MARVIFCKGFMFALTPCIFISHFWYGWDVEFVWGFWSVIIGANPENSKLYEKEVIG